MRGNMRGSRELLRGELEEKERKCKEEGRRRGITKRGNLRKGGKRGELMRGEIAGGEEIERITERRKLRKKGGVGREI